MPKTISQTSSSENPNSLVGGFLAAGALHALHRSEIDVDVFLRRIVDTCASGVAVLDEFGTVLCVSPAWGLCAAQFPLPSEWNDSYSRFGDATVERGNPLPEDIQLILAGRQREFHKEYSFPGDDGLQWFLVHAARLDLPETNRFRVLVTLEDVTRHREAEEALRNLGGLLINAQEEERSRIARELHDDLSQQLAIMSIEIQQLGQKIPGDDQDIKGLVRGLLAKAQDISSEIHRLSYKLHPAKLDHLGLAAAIKGLCAELSDHRDVKIDFRQKGFPATLSKDVTLCVFRIAQESLQNVVRHSGAHEAQVVLRKSARALHLRVSDAGCGFDARSSRTKAGLGFISMRERLRLVGGKISIRSQPFSGTQIDVVVPI